MGSSDGVLPGFLLTGEFIVAFLLAFYLLHVYSNIRRQNPVVTGSTLLIWFLSFVIIFLLPVDVSSVREREGGRVCRDFV